RQGRRRPHRLLVDGGEVVGGRGRVGPERRVAQRADHGPRVDRGPDLAVGRRALGGATPEVGPAGPPPPARRPLVAGGLGRGRSLPVAVAPPLAAVAAAGRIGRHQAASSSPVLPSRPTSSTMASGRSPRAERSSAALRSPSELLAGSTRSAMRRLPATT